MDILIKDGDMVLDKTGAPIYISGDDEILQQALFMIGTKKGAFIYNKEMGIQAVTSPCTQRAMKELESRLKEAVMKIEGVRLFLQDAEELIDGRVKALITLSIGDKEIEAEVITDADL